MRQFLPQGSGGSHSQEADACHSRSIESRAFEVSLSELLNDPTFHHFFLLRRRRLTIASYRCGLSHLAISLANSSLLPRAQCAVIPFLLE